MIIVKLTHPSGWFANGHWPYENHFPKNDNCWGNFRFEINNDVKECDFWVVHESVERDETVHCAFENIILVTGEEKTQIPFYDQKYLDQFGMIITSRDDIRHPNVLRMFYLAPWSVKKTFQQILSASPSKVNDFSAVISNRVSSDSHLKRYAFVNKLKGHFKDKMVWFGKGENAIEDKWDGLAAFRYSLALENSSAPFYFTEKIMDCYCANVMPIYWGCPNITDFFPAQSLVGIDLYDFKSSINIIEEAINENAFEKNYEAILQSKNLVLTKYQFIAAIGDALQSLRKHQKPRQSIKIRPKNSFSQRTLLRKVLSKIGRVN
jgi:hypothetical protein